MAGKPRILASFVQGTLEAIDALDADLGRRVRATLKPETLEAIEGAWAASWLPIRHDVELTAAFFEAAGAERACRVMRQNLAVTFRKPILKPMTDAAVRVLGLHPEKILGWAPRVWPLLFRDAGELRVEAKEGHATLWLEGLPPEVAENRDYLVGTAAAISAIFDLTGMAGACQLEESGRGQARFAARWHAT